MQLSKYFTLAEVTASETAVRKSIDNTPSAEVIENLREACRRADEVRELLGHPVVVLSGYRSPKLNAVIGGSKTSSHMQGEALDMICPMFGTPADVFKAIRESGIKFDQLILEFAGKPNAWVHIGFGRAMRGQVLIYDGKTYGRA